jgi:hypothetical protein
MDELLKKLYQGELRPSEKRNAHSPALAQAMLEVCRMEDGLMEDLEGEYKEKLQALIDAYGEMEAMEAEESFVDGFRLGARLTMEVLEEGSPLDKYKKITITAMDP